jgi:hypothetical protein
MVEHRLAVESLFRHCREGPSASDLGRLQCVYRLVVVEPGRDDVDVVHPEEESPQDEHRHHRPLHLRTQVPRSRRRGLVLGRNPRRAATGSRPRSIRQAPQQHGGRHHVQHHPRHGAEQRRDAAGRQKVLRRHGEHRRQRNPKLADPIADP